MTRLSHPIGAALQRLVLVSGRSGFWETAFLRAVEAYHAAVEVEARTAHQGAAVGRTPDAPRLPSSGK